MIKREKDELNWRVQGNQPLNKMITWLIVYLLIIRIVIIKTRTEKNELNKTVQ